MAEKSPQAKGSTPAPRGRPATTPATAPGARGAGSAQERPALASLRAAAERLAEEERARPAVMSSSRPATVVSEPRQVFAARPVPASAPAVPPVPPPPPAAYPVPPVPRPTSPQGYTAPPQMAFGATTSSAGPSRRGYALAAAIAIVGLVIGVGGVVRGFSQLSDRVDRLERIDVPGSRDLTFVRMST